MNRFSRDEQPTIPRHEPHFGYVAPVPPPSTGDAAGIPDQTASVSFGTVQGAVKQLGASNPT